MDEEKKEDQPEEKEEAEVQKDPTDNKNVGAEKSKLIKEAKEAGAAIKAENDRREKLIEREEKLIERKEVVAALGGGSLAGDKPEKKEETPEEYKNRVMKNEIK